MFKRWLTPTFFLFFAFGLALTLRIINLGSMPVRLHQDEVMNGYVGRYILQNGKDPLGNRWPIFYFNNFGDYPNVVPMYLSGLSTYVFGVNEFAIRFPIALVAAMVVFPIYAILEFITKDKKTALFGALAVAILPWHIVLSRATAEQGLGITVYLSGLYFLLRSAESEKLKALVASVGLFASSYFLYPSCRILVPLTFLAAIFVAKRKMRWAILILGWVFFLATGLISRTPWGSGRFTQTSIFAFNGQSNARAQGAAFAAGQGKIMFVRIFNNKLVVYSREFVRQYLSYFSFNFLFTDGGHPDRYRVPDQGLLYYSFGLIPFLALIGIYVSPKQFRQVKTPDKALALFIGVILLLSPVAAALTLDEVPNVHRSALLGVMLIFPLALGFHYLRHLKIWKIKPMILLAVLLTLEGVYFLNQYFVQAPAAETVARYDERTDLTLWLITNRGKYDQVYVTREIFSLYYLFYTKNFNPNLAGKFIFPLIIPQIDNLHFIDHNCPTAMPNVPTKGNILVIDKSECDTPPNFKLLETHTRTNGTAAYNLYVPLPALPKSK